METAIERFELGLEPSKDAVLQRQFEGVCAHLVAGTSEGRGLKREPAIGLDGGQKQHQRCFAAVQPAGLAGGVQLPGKFLATGDRPTGIIDDEPVQVHH